MSAQGQGPKLGSLRADMPLSFLIGDPCHYHLSLGLASSGLPALSSPHLPFLPLVSMQGLHRNLSQSCHSSAQKPPVALHSPILCIKAEVCSVLRDISLTSSSSFSLSRCSSTLASLLFPRPALGPLHLLVHLPGMLFPWISLWLAPHLFQVFCSIVTFSEGPG